MNTLGYKGQNESRLHFGNIYFANNGGSAIFLVIHPNNWGPCQHRFATSSFTAAFHTVVNAVTGAGVGAGVTAGLAAAATTGGALGSFVPGPGTVVCIFIYF